MTAARGASSRGRTVTLFAASGVFTLGDGAVLLLLAPLLAARGIDETLIGPMVAAYSVASLVFRFITGAVYRAHRLRYLVPAGCVIQAGAFVVLSVTTSALVLTAAIAFNGMGFAIASTGGLAAVMEVRADGDAGTSMGWYTGCVGAGYGLAGFVGGIAGDALGLANALLAVAGFPVIAAAALGAALWHVGRGGTEPQTTHHQDVPSGHTGSRLRRLLTVGPLVWLAFFCALHINLLSGVLLTFFPLYGLAIGLSLTQIGALTGASSALSSGLRFLSPALFKRIDYRSVLPWMVLLGGAATAALKISTVYVVLLVAWLGIGTSRALLRVSSAALVMDATRGESDQRGAASGIYMAGLDVGKIIGPVLGGLSVSTLGYGVTFVLVGCAVPVVFFSYYLPLRARGTGLDEG